MRRKSYCHKVVTVTVKPLGIRIAKGTTLVDAVKGEAERLGIQVKLTQRVTQLVKAENMSRLFGSSAERGWEIPLSTRQRGKTTISYPPKLTYLKPFLNP
eukprot:260805-Amorphochlora_amoeboformis.AAC.1